MTTKNSGAKPIPAFRRVTINSDSDLPDRGVAATPGGTVRCSTYRKESVLTILSFFPTGTLFSTTPGGTRIIYDRAFLMNLRNSPLAKSPPKMAYIAGVTNISAENGQANLTKKGKGNVLNHQIICYSRTN